MTWEQITKADISDMLLQISIYGRKTEVGRFKRMAFEMQQRVTFVLKQRAARHKRDGENPYDYHIIKEVIEDALSGLFIDVNEDRVR